MLYTDASKNIWKILATRLADSQDSCPWSKAESVTACAALLKVEKPVSKGVHSFRNTRRFAVARSAFVRPTAPEGRLTRTVGGGPRSGKHDGSAAMCRTRFLRAVTLLLAAAVRQPAFAQSGGPYAITSSVIAGGGATASTGAGDTLGGTIGQAVAGHLAGGVYAVNDGFWQPQEGVAATPSPTITMVATVNVTPTVPDTPVPSATTTIAPPTPSPTSATGHTPTATVTTAPSPNASATRPATTTPTPSPTPTVTGARGDSNCDGSVTAADTSALIRNVITGERAPCGLDDVNGDGRVDDSDIDPLVGVIFDEP